MPIKDPTNSTQLVPVMTNMVPKFNNLKLSEKAVTFQDIAPSHVLPEGSKYVNSRAVDLMLFLLRPVEYFNILTPG